MCFPYTLTQDRSWNFSGQLGCKLINIHDFPDHSHINLVPEQQLVEVLSNPCILFVCLAGHQHGNCDIRSLGDIAFPFAPSKVPTIEVKGNERNRSRHAVEMFSL